MTVETQAVALTAVLIPSNFVLSSYLARGRLEYCSYCHGSLVRFSWIRASPIGILGQQAQMLRSDAHCV